MTRICVVGTGYVGLVTAACFAELGNHVVGIDTDTDRVASLQRGEVPFFEPGLDTLVERNREAGRLRFTTSYPEGIERAEFIFLCLPTPPLANGAADTSILRAAVRQLAPLLKAPYPVLISKSTAPVGTCTNLHRLLEGLDRRLGEVPVVANPEFLREGSAVSDFMNPDRVVIGSHCASASARVCTLYAPLRVPCLTVSLETAEMVKYASNAFLATKISFINEIANVCERVGADVSEVAKGMGLDHRIGASFLRPGIGYGGSCFPKDVQALAHLSALHGQQPRILRSVMEVNADQATRIVDKLRSQLGTLDGAVVAVWGISFKPNTDDIRESPAIEVINLLAQEGARVRAYDPVAMPKAAPHLTSVTLCDSPYEAATGAQALLLATEWDEFRAADLHRVAAVMERPILVDGRNAIDPDRARAAGFHYRGVGRQSLAPVHHLPVEKRAAS